MAIATSTRRSRLRARLAAVPRTELLFAAAVAATVIGAAAVRFPPALGDAFWQDEVASAEILVEPSLGDALWRIVRSESTPPAWYVLGWLGHQAGASVESMRLLSVLASLALVPLVAYAARSVVSVPFAALAAATTAFGFQFVKHGWELRAYALLTLVVVLFALAFERAAATPTKGRLGLVAAATAVGSLTHYFFLFTVAAALLWVGIWRPARRAWRPLGLAAALGLVPLALWTPALAEQYSHQRFAWLGPFDVAHVADVYRALFAPPLGSHATANRALGLLLSTGVVLGAVLLARTGARGSLFATLAVVPVVLAGIAWRLGAEVFHVKNLLVAAPFAAIAIVAAVAALPKLPAILGAAALVALLAASVQGQEARPAYDDAARRLVALGWDRTEPIVVLSAPYDVAIPIHWYLPGRPRLVEGRPTGRPCRAVYVISRERRWLELRAPPPLDPQVETEGLVLGRLAASRSSALPKRGRAFAVLGAPQPCLDLAE